MSIISTVVTNSTNLTKEQIRPGAVRQLQHGAQPCPWPHVHVAQLHHGCNRNLCIAVGTCTCISVSQSPHCTQTGMSPAHTSSSSFPTSRGNSTTSSSDVLVGFTSLTLATRNFGKIISYIFGATIGFAPTPPLLHVVMPNTKCWK